MSEPIQDGQSAPVPQPMPAQQPGGVQPYAPPQFPPQPYPQQAYGQQAYGQPQYAAPPMVVAPKNPGIGLLASFFVPGLGSLINGDVGIGIGIFIGYLIGWFFSFFLIGIPFVFGFWVWGMVDGYTGAQRWNARHGIIS